MLGVSLLTTAAICFLLSLGLAFTLYGMAAAVVACLALAGGVFFLRR